MIQTENDDSNQIAIFLIAIGPYIRLLPDLIKGCEAFFFPSTNKHYFVFTDNISEASRILPKQTPITAIGVPYCKWPFPTLNRFTYLLLAEDLIKRTANPSNLFFLNANCRFVQTIDEKEILTSQLVACAHPGYWNSPPEVAPYEKRSDSEAYVEDCAKGMVYAAGGLQGGASTELWHAYRKCQEMVATDIQKGLIAKWHDESYWNKYLISIKYEKVLILNPSHLYPEGWNLNISPKILLLDKRHLINAEKQYS